MSEFDLAARARGLTFKAAGGLYLARKTVQEFWAGSRRSKNDSYTFSRLENQSPARELNAKICCVAHIFYEDLFEPITEKLLGLDSIGKLIITSPHSKVIDLAEGLSRSLNDGRVVSLKFENRGRNFGPLFQAVESLGQDWDYLLHVHSKKSLHSNKAVGRNWLESVLNVLADQNHLESILNIMRVDSQIAVAHVNPVTKVRKINLTWGRNFDSVSEIAHKIGISEPESRTSYLCFPVGGMFLLRMSAYKGLFSLGLTNFDFPSEPGLLDGEVHHGVERLIGQIADSLGHAQLLSTIDSSGRLTLDRVLYRTEDKIKPGGFRC